MSSQVKAVEVFKFSVIGTDQKQDLVAVEEPLEIRIGYGATNYRQQKSLAVTMRTPGNDIELTLGFLVTEGIIESFDQVESIKHCNDVGRTEEKENIFRVELKPDVVFDFQKLQRNFYTTSSCGVCGKSSIDAITAKCRELSSDWRLNSELIYSLPEKLRKAQRVFEHTGGLHACGLFSRTGELVLLREDVGRHNALDKVIGAMLLKSFLPLNDFIVMVSGRASFELVQKAALAGIPIMAAVGAPSSLAVSLANDCGMTLIGFLREERFNVYAHAQRLKSINN
ncbi:MAG: formate dehydrogenase accessory sulfurtransferase FdhD [Cyclobacteriaceae bacterium]|jgi:FdhD protein|nr:formate dehydrogenase accessory sulfurtransferase FdhD [Cyclobacteriaceae bacterium]